MISSKKALLSLIALFVMLLGCNFSSSAGGATVTNDLRSTPISTPWEQPTLTPTVFQTATTAPTQTPAPTATSRPQNTGNNNANLGYVVNTAPPAPACGLVPAGSYNVNIRAQANVNAAVVGTLKPGAWVYASRVSGNWYQVQYPGTPVNGAWISGDVVTVTQPCTCTAASCANVPPPPLTCTITNQHAHGVMSEPYGYGYPVTQLGPNTTSVPVARLADGSHYRLQTPAGSAWISVAANVTLNGNCNGVPVEAYNPPPQACTVRNQMAHGVLSEPYGSGYPVTQLGPNTNSRALARTSDSAFYQIETPAGAGWISAAANVTITGNCGQLPVMDTTQECRLQLKQTVDVFPMPGWGQPITQLSAGAYAIGRARTPAGDYYKVSTHAGDGWVHVLYGVDRSAKCDTVPVEDTAPPPSSSSTTHTSRAFALNYPANWHVQDAGDRVIVTSYNPAYGDPARAAFADPALVKITITTLAFGGSYEEWVAQYMAQVDNVTLRVAGDQTLALPDGSQARRLDMIGGTGGFPVLLAVIKGSGIYGEGMLANTAFFDRVASTLRAAP